MKGNQTYKFIPLASMCCWVRIDHSLKDEEWKWVSMGLMSNHMHHEQARLLGFNGRIRRAWSANVTADNHAYPQRRRMVIDYVTESREHAVPFEDELVAKAREATSVAVRRIRIVHYDHVRAFKPRRA